MLTSPAAHRDKFRIRLSDAHGSILHAVDTRRKRHRRTAKDRPARGLKDDGDGEGKPEGRATVAERANQTTSGPAYTLYTAGAPTGASQSCTSSLPSPCQAVTAHPQSEVWLCPSASWKASIVLEELNLTYEIRSLSLGKDEQKDPSFLKINPNGRIPAIVDHSAGELPVFESGPIMWYLASKDSQHKLWPKGLSGQAEVMSWLMFQMGGVGPMQGQASHFLRFAPDKSEYGIDRYRAETRRMYEVIDSHLGDHTWLAAEQYSIADIANFSWIHAHACAGVQTGDLQHLEEWMERIAMRPAVQKGINVPEPNRLAGIPSEEDVQAMLAEARKYTGSDGKVA